MDNMRIKTGVGTGGAMCRGVGPTVGPEHSDESQNTVDEATSTKRPTHATSKRHVRALVESASRPAAGQNTIISAGPLTTLRPARAIGRVHGIPPGPGAVLR